MILKTSDEIMQLLLVSRMHVGNVVMATHDYMVIQKHPARILKTENGKVIDNAAAAA